MGHPSQKDLEKLLFGINNLHSDTNPSGLGRRLIDSVKIVIAGEIIAFDVFDLAGVHKGTIAWDSVAALIKDDLQIFADCVTEHPFFGDIFLDKEFDALIISNFFSIKNFYQTGVYNQFYRRVGVNRQLVIALPIDCERIITCAICRIQKDFTEKDRLLLNLLAGHLIQAIRNSQAFERLELVMQNQSTGVAIVSGDGSMQYINESARLFLTKYFGNEKSNTDNLPDVLINWVKELQLLSNSQFISSSVPLIIKGDSGKLFVRLIYNAPTREIIFILKEKTSLTPDELKPLNLTQRESEILVLITQGKSDEIIASLCYISPRTVQKHIEHIYNKLGVDSRTLAAVKSLELLR